MGMDGCMHRFIKPFNYNKDGEIVGGVEGSYLVGNGELDVVCVSGLETFDPAGCRCASSFVCGCFRCMGLERHCGCMWA